MAHAPILLTRPEPASQRFAAAIAARLGAGPVVVSPLLEILPVGGVPSLDGYAGVILTSENALLRTDPRWPRQLPAYCVGARTAAVASAAGFTAHSAQGALANLVSLIYTLPPTGRLLYLRGRHVTGGIGQELTAHGFPTDEVVVYDQQLHTLSQAARDVLAQPGPVLIPVFSSRTAIALGAELKNVSASLHIAAISPAVVDTLAVQSAARIEVAQRPDAEAVLDCLEVLQMALRA